MALFTRRERTPAELISMLPGDERVVSWADTDTETFVAATPAGLWWPAAEGLRRIGWERIDKAVWQDGQLIVTEADVIDDLLLVDRPPVAARLVTARDLPPTVRKRVEANIVTSELYPVAGGTARFVARRVPGRDGLVWWVRLENGLGADERLRAQVQDIVAELRTGTSDAQLW